MSNARRYGAKRMKRDRHGGIEGLPLQLMILVLIAGVGSAVMMGWMTGLKAPSSITSVHAEPGEIMLRDSYGNGVFENRSISLEVMVLDQNGDGVEGAVVVLDGCGIVNAYGGTAYAKTDATGTANFNGLQASYSGGLLGFVSVKVSKGGTGTDASYSIPVVCG